MSLPSQLPPGPAGTRRAALRAAAVACLDGYVRTWVAAPPDLPEDPGPAVLAALLSADGAEWHASRAVTAWRHGFHRGTARGGLDRGHAGYVAGLSCLAATDHRLRGLAEREGQALAQRWTATPLSGTGYSLIDGVSGAVLALACGPITAPDRVAGLARRLAASSGWPAGMSPGLGYGVAGVVAALRAGYEHGGRDGECGAALRRGCAWLAEHLDGTGGWASGTPGVAWALWDAGRVLDDAGLRERAAAAMRGYCAGAGEFAELSFRDGAAGVLAVADAFARHAGLAAAQDLRDRLAERLADRLDEIPGRQALLLDGASGVFAALLTSAGADRRWLIPYGLR